MIYTRLPSSSVALYWEVCIATYLKRANDDDWRSSSAIFVNMLLTNERM